jgi:hypothetical protein
MSSQGREGGSADASRHDRDTVRSVDVPAPGPLRCRFRSRFVHDGLLDEDGEIWDSAGTLVAQSRQLALMPRPPA